MKKFLPILIFTLLLCFSFGINAEEESRISRVLTIEGDVFVKSPDVPDAVSAHPGMALNERDIIITGKDSKAVLNVNGRAESATVEVDENSQLMLLELKKDKKTGTENTLLDLAVGKILVKARELRDPDSKFEVKTPTSVVGVRGTNFSVEVEAVEKKSP